MMDERIFPSRDCKFSRRSPRAVDHLQRTFDSLIIYSELSILRMAVRMSRVVETRNQTKFAPPSYSKQNIMRTIIVIGLRIVLAPFYLNQAVLKVSC